jgi:hypothetical protein
MTAPHPVVLRRIADVDEFDRLLSELNEAGITPTVVGLDAHGSPFLAYGWAPGGDGWDTGVLVDDPYSYEFDYTDGHRCEECNSEGRRPLSALSYPVMVLGAQ